MAGQAITNPACLRDCFSSSSTDDDCFELLLEDVITKGTCIEATGNPASTLNIWGANTFVDVCIYNEDYDYENSDRDDEW